MLIILDPSNYRYGDVEVEVIALPERTAKNVVVSGVLLSFDEIDRRLSRRKIGQNYVYLHDVVSRAVSTLFYFKI